MAFRNHLNSIRNLYLKNGKYFLKYKRKKTGISSSQVVSEPLDMLLKKYESHPHCSLEGYLIPKKGLNELNKNLKIIGVMAQVPTPLTSYFTRRFFRQSIYEANIRESLIVKTLMGHSRKDDIDARYLTIKDEMLLETSLKLNTFYKNNSL